MNYLMNILWTFSDDSLEMTTRSTWMFSHVTSYKVVLHWNCANLKFVPLLLDFGSTKKAGINFHILSCNSFTVHNATVGALCPLALAVIYFYSFSVIWSNDEKVLKLPNYNFVNLFSWTAGQKTLHMGHCHPRLLFPCYTWKYDESITSSIKIY